MIFVADFLDGGILSDELNDYTEADFKAAMANMEEEGKTNIQILEALSQKGRLHKTC